jgi:hypothetical protein
MHPAVRPKSMINFQLIIETVTAKWGITTLIMTELRDKWRDHDWVA